ncbi:PH domain-containing protein [Halobacillus rhizosphaerae]|uniref:PH domain-containing protein n=1 Tax=Halobacillus rhizosphaerae TaxID=3064889 RepID=UPI00398B388A
MKYASKRDLWITLVIWLGILSTSYGGVHALFFTNPGQLEGFILMLLIAGIPGILLWVWNSTYYLLTEKHIIIRSGPFRKTIDLENVKAAKRTRTPMSSPALSLQRIEILLTNYGMAIMSPRHREDFLKQLDDYCPDANIEK